LGLKDNAFTRTNDQGIRDDGAECFKGQEAAQIVGRCIAALFDASTLVKTAVVLPRVVVRAKAGAILVLY